MNYLIDTSALHRLDQLPVTSVLGPLIESGRVSICAVTELEVLFSARGLAEYERESAGVALRKIARHANSHTAISPR